MGDQSISTSMVGLAEEVELGDGGEEGEEEDTLGVTLGHSWSLMGVKGLIEIRHDNKLDNVMELEYS